MGFLLFVFFFYRSTAQADFSQHFLPSGGKLAPAGLGWLAGLRGARFRADWQNEIGIPHGDVMTLWAAADDPHFLSLMAFFPIDVLSSCSIQRLQNQRHCI